MKKLAIVAILILSVFLMGSSRGRYVYIRSQKIAQSTPIIYAVAPVSDFTISGSVNGRAPQTITFEDASTGGATSWLWDFGGLATSTAQDTVYTFGTGSPANVTLTVSNDAGEDAKIVTSAVDLLDPYFKIVTFSIVMASGKIRCAPVAMTPWSNGTVYIRYYNDETNAVLSNAPGVSANYGATPTANPAGVTVADGVDIRVAYWTTNARTGFANAGSSSAPITLGVWTMVNGTGSIDNLTPQDQPVD